MITSEHLHSHLVLNYVATVSKQKFSISFQSNVFSKPARELDLAEEGNPAYGFFLKSTQTPFTSFFSDTKLFGARLLLMWLHKLCLD